MKDRNTKFFCLIQFAKHHIGNIPTQNSTDILVALALVDIVLIVQQIYEEYNKLRVLSWTFQNMQIVRNIILVKFAKTSAWPTVWHRVLCTAIPEPGDLMVVWSLVRFLVGWFCFALKRRMKNCEKVWNGVKLFDIVRTMISTMIRAC